MNNILNTFKLWQIGVLVAVLVGAAGGSFAVINALSDTSSTNLAEGEQAIVVGVGDLVNDISINGSLAYPNRETLVFGTQGTVASVLVDAGDRVEEGDPLATLDAETVTALTKSVAQARVNLQNAEEALESAKEPNTPLQMAQAESKVANARVSLQKAQDALAAVEAPSPQDIAKAESAVFSAQAALTDARDALSDVESGLDLADAESDLAAAHLDLRNAETNLLLIQNDWDGRSEDAIDTREAARDDYQTVFEKWLGIQLTEEQIETDPDSLLNEWNVDLEALFDPNARLEDSSRAYLAVGPPTDNPVTAWDELTVYIWRNLHPSPILAVCGGAVPAGTECVYEDLTDAWDDYQTAILDVDSTVVQGGKAVGTGQIALEKAQGDLAAAERALDDQSSESPLRQAEGQVVIAQANLTDTEAEVAEMSTGGDPLVAAARGMDVAVAQAALDEAEADLAEVLAGADSLQVALRVSDLAASQAALDTALLSLNNAIIEAPWAGIISSVPVAVGQAVNRSTPIMEIVDPTVIEVDGIVDEIDVLFTRIGAPATVTLDALPGQTLQGEVSNIATASQNQQGVVTYPLSIRIDLPDGLELPEGLTAVSQVIIRAEEDVLLVPIQSLYGTFQQPVVRVVSTNGSVEERAVTLGSSDDFWAVVEEGLAPGEKVVIEVQDATTGGFGGIGRIAAGGSFGGFGGGGGGGRTFTGGGGGGGGPR